MWKWMSEIMDAAVRSDYVEAAKRQATRCQERADEMEAALERFAAYKASLTITDMVREQLKGINPRLLDNQNDILVDMVGDDSIDTFLAACHDLHKSTALTKIIDYLERDQVLYSAKTAVGLEEINFGRATINGLSLLREEVERLDTVYVERHATEPEFDEHEVV